MAFIPTPEGIEIVVHGAQEGIPVVNTYHVSAGGSPTDTQLQDAAEAVSSWMITDMIPYLDSTYVIQDVVATDISVADGHQFTDLSAAGYGGTIVGAPMAANAAVVISWRTARTGRSYRGRTYIGGLNNGILLDPHNITTVYAGHYATAGQSLIDILAVAGLVLSVLSKVADKVARVAGVLTEIVSLIVDTKVDSQRRRTAN